MRIFEIVKENVNLREAAELYGIDVNRYGKALCPFHNDRNPSLYVADDHYYCFACGEHGDLSIPKAPNMAGRIPSRNDGTATSSLSSGVRHGRM